jgi:predicted phage terminase large subunit-like protein
VRPIPQMVADGVEHVRQFKPDGFIIEGNSFQELLATEFMRAGEEQKVHLPIYITNSVTNKQVRIRRLGSYLAQRKMRFKENTPGTALLIRQLRDFPAGQHDDGPDALEMALQLAIQLHNDKVEAMPVRMKA